MRTLSFLMTMVTTAASDPVMGDVPEIFRSVKETAGACVAHGTTTLVQS